MDWMVLVIAGLGALSCVGLMQAVSWVAVRLRRQGNRVYRVVPVGGAGAAIGGQMALAFACLQWLSNPEGAKLVLYDVGLTPAQAQACARLAQGAGIWFARTPQELAALLAGEGRKSEQ